MTKENFVTIYYTRPGNPQLFTANAQEWEIDRLNLMGTFRFGPVGAWMARGSAILIDTQLETAGLSGSRDAWSSEVLATAIEEPR